MPGKNVEGLRDVISGSIDKELLHLPDACTDNVSHQNFLDVLRWNARPLKSTCRSDSASIL